VGYAVATLPLGPLAVLGAGESWRAAPTRPVSIYAGDEEPPLENPLAAVGGRFDLAFAVIWLLPLAILVTGHAVVSSDRQEGIWPSVLATGADPVRVLLRRILWPAILLVVVTVAVALASVGAAGLPGAPGDGGRLAVWAAALLAYAAVWVGITAAATSWARTTAVALLSLGLTWLALVWAVPAVVDALALQLHPPPNRWAADVAARESSRDLDADLPAMLEAVYAEHPEWRPSDEEVAAARRPVPGGPASRDARRVYVPARHAAASAAAERATLRAARTAVEAVVATASVTSPALLLQRVLDAVGGASVERYAAFEAVVEQLEVSWHGFFAPRIMRLRDLTAADAAAVPLPARGGVQLPPPVVPVKPLLGLLAWAIGVGVLLVWNRAGLYH